jgi:GDP/UDP-N,N'-diacetylbacillosamine 2-epimerase (hydrolysing)
MNRSKSKKKILVLTTNRSDYGLFRKLILGIKKTKKLDLKLVVAGSHLLKKYGHSINEIKKDKIPIFKTICSNYVGDSKMAISQYNIDMAKKFNKILSKNNFDIVLVLGDRSEILFCSGLSLIYNYKLAHFHGGETTKGVIDNQVRNAVSQLSDFHFVSHADYREKLLRMGIDKKKVFLVGGLGASSINSIKLLSKNIIQKKLKLNLSKKYLVITYHPVTLKEYDVKKEFENLMNCLDDYKDVIKIITAPNIDNNNIKIINTINLFIKKKTNFYFFKSLGSLNYYSLLKYSSGVIGNSSSGILEAPSFKIPTINIGNRQAGRKGSQSIINCNSTKQSILKALNKIFNNKKFKTSLQKVTNPYYQINTEKKIIKQLLKI